MQDDFNYFCTPQRGKSSCQISCVKKALEIFGCYSKKIVSIKSYLVLSNGELLIVYNIVRNGSLRSNVVFEKKAISHSHIKDIRPESTQICGTRVCFLSLYSCNLMTNWAQLFIGSWIHQVRILAFDIY